MLKQTLNELRVKLEIRPNSPLLIKEGRHDPRPDEGSPRLVFHRGVQRTPRAPRPREGHGPANYSDPDHCFDMAFVYSHTSEGDRFYIPGSSLRGVLRAAAERIVARWRPDLVSDPFARAGQPRAGTDQQFIQAYGDEHRPPGDMIYRRALPIERCFGHTLLRGRWTVADAWMANEQQASVIVRDGVGINRHTGAAENHIKYQFEAITGGVFTTTLTLVNYELWQLGLLAHTLAALDGGAARLGYGTRRGLGRVRLRVRRLGWRWFVPALRPDQDAGQVAIPSLARLAEAARVEGDYGWRETDDPLSLALTLDREAGGLVSEWQIVPEGDDPLAAPPWPQLGPLLPTALERWPVPEEVTS